MNLSVAHIQEIIAEKIPKGLVVPEHTDSGHFYRHIPSGKLLASVTTKSSSMLNNPHLKLWAARLAVEHFHATVSLDPSMIEPGKVEILKDAAIMVHQDQFEDAGGIGTLGHGAIERFLIDWIATGERPARDITSYIEGEDSRLWAITRSADLFMRDFYALPIASELFVASVKHEYAGTLDGLMLVILPGKKCTTEDRRHHFLQASSSNPLKVICAHCHHVDRYVFALTDWKTSNSINKPEYAMQVSAYAKALTEMTGLKPKVLIVIRIDKKQAKYDAVRVGNPKAAFDAFKHLTHVYDWLHSEGKQLIPLVEKDIIQLI